MIDLPFFDDRHRTLQSRLAGIGERFDPITVRGESFEVDQGGGDGLDLRSLCLAREALAAASGLTDAVFAVQGLGSYPIALSGSRAIGERYLPDVADGRAIAAFAITEPDAGSDVGAIATRAVRD